MIPTLYTHVEALSDEDWDIPCGDTTTGKCEESAQWILWTIPCCPDCTPFFLRCDFHKDLFLNNPVPHRCRDCGWRRLLRHVIRSVEPLNRRTAIDGLGEST